MLPTFAPFRAGSTGTAVTAASAAMVTIFLSVAGPTPAAAAQRSPTAAAPDSGNTAGAFTALAPARLLDTRNGTGAPKAALAARATLTLTVAGHGGVPSTGAAAAAVNVTVTGPAVGGNITVFPAGTSEPTASNLNFSAGQTIPNLVIAKLGTSGQIKLTNNSSGTVNLVADVSGYYASGTATVAGAFTPLAPYRILDTRIGTGATRGAVPAHGTVPLTVTGNGSSTQVPVSGVSAVAVNVTVTGPTVGGNVTVYPTGVREPTASNLNFSAGQTIPNLVIASVGSGGRIDLTNNTAGTVQLVADVAGYFTAGAPLAAGAFGTAPPSRLLDTRTGNGAPEVPVGANQALTLTVTGRGGVPVGGVSAVVVNVTVTGATNGGNITVYPAGTSEPTASNLNYAAGHTIPNLVIAKVGTNGQIVLANNSKGTVNLVADVTGYHLTSALPLPTTSPSYYLRTLTGATDHDQPILDARGCTDATAAANSGDATARTVVLDFGAQTVHDPVETGGVLLTTTDTRITYSDVVTDVQTYIGGWSSCIGAGPTVTIAVSTNSDGEWDSYTAESRADAWADDVISPSRASLPAGVAVVGATDIEAGFAATVAQAAAWITEYTVTDGQPLIETGSADGCPTAAGAAGSKCQAVPIDGGPTTQVWTQANYFSLAHGLAPTQIQVLPQTYDPVQAVQWQNINLTGATVGDHIDFIGSLTEAATPSSGSQASDQGWAQLYQQLSTSSITSQSLPSAVDLGVL